MGRLLTRVFLAGVAVATVIGPGAGGESVAAAVPPPLPAGWIDTVFGARVDRADARTVDLQALGAYSRTVVNDEILYPVMAVGDDRSVYFVARDMIFQVRPDRSMRRIAGIGVADDFGTGGPALQRPIRGVTNISVDSAGVVTFTESLADRIRFGQIGIDGTVRPVHEVIRSACPTFPRVPGEGTGCTIDDAYLGPDGSVYEVFNAGQGARLGVQRPNGSHSWIAGNGDQTTAPVDGSLATTMGLRARGAFSRGSFGIAPGPNGKVSLIVGQQPGDISGLPQPTTVVDITSDGVVHVRPGHLGAVHLAADAVGNLYSADLVEVTAVSGTGPVRRMDTNGSVSDLGFAGSGLLDFAVSPSGRYVAALDTALRVLEVGGAVDTVAGSTPTPDETVLAQGLGADGRQVPAFRGRPPADAGYVPEIAADPDGSMLVPNSNRMGMELTRLGTDGSTSTFLCGGFAPRVAMSVAGDRTLFCDVSKQPDPGDTNFGRLMRVGAGGSDTVPLDMPGNTSGPGALAAVDADHVYVLAGNEVFLATDNGGTWSTRRVAGVEFPCASLVDPCAGQDGGDATSMALFEPRGIAVAPDGGLYIAEASVPPRPGETSPGGWVRRLTPDGRLLRFAGTGTYGSGGDAGPALEAQLGGPTGVAVAPDGAVIIADLFASRVRRVTTDGRIQTIGGDSTYTGQVDTGPAVGPVFVAPVSVTVDTRGYVYVLDMGTGLLRRIAPGAAEVLGAAVASFVPVAPTRLLDTRTLGQGPLPPAGQTSLRVVGIGTTDGKTVPSDATAVVLNVTATEALDRGFVQVLPTGQAAIASSSNLNIEEPGQTIANLVTVPVGVDGTVTFFLQGGGHVIADLFGYFAPTNAAVSAGRYVALVPSRVLDTRIGLGQSVPHKPGPSESVHLSLAGVGGLPATGVSAVALNVTLTEATAPGFVQVIPTGGATEPGRSSNLNAEQADATIANLAIVPVGADGSVTLFTQSGTHLVVDVAGYFTDSSAAPSLSGLFVPATPTRLLDTRLTSPGPIAAGGTATVETTGGAGLAAGIRPGRVAAVVANLTATEAEGPGYVQGIPTNHGIFGSSSNVNIQHAGQTIANAAMLTVGDGDDVTLFTFNATHLICDVAGWFLR